jgi:hypothetical protein
MDLDRCPRCGSKWMGGEFCPNCKFVPIGAGLKNSKKKKKKVRRYVEPGSSRGLLTVIFLGLVGYGCFKYQPWKDDWEMVRAVFGQGRHHSLVGEWEVVKTVAAKNQQGMVARDNVEKGIVKFSDKGGVKMDLMHPQSETLASGMYKVDGTKVAMRDLRTTGDSSDPIPTVINMNLAWTGKDNVIAMDKTEAIYLRRHKSGNPLTTFMQMGLRKDVKPDSGQIPGEMRGVIGNLKRSMQDNEDFANNN